MVIFNSYVKLPEGNHGNFCGAPRYFTATWDDQLPMEISKIFPRNPERPRVSWREVLMPGREIGGLSGYPNNYRWLMMLSIYVYI
jgi:hypothetical protein